MNNQYPISSKLDHIPDHVVALSDYERLAVDFIPSPVFEYIHSGAADEITLHNNRTAFDRIQLYNRVLADVSKASTHTQLFGQAFRHPVLLAPVAHQGLVHADGELASAQGASATDSGLVASTLSTFSLEAIAQQQDQAKWFQLYFQPQREKTLQLVRRAESAGYSALVVTVDVPINGLRNRTQRAGFNLPEGLGSGNFPPAENSTPIELTGDESVVFQGIMQQAPGWDDLQWLRDNSQLPILLKGVSHPLDAQRAIACGMDGLVVSNHGGRGLDSVPASIDALRAIRQCIGDQPTVVLDSGIRRGSDVFKALALGANAVMVGRPQLYALAVAGALGVAHMLKLLRDELEVTMALTGCDSITAINSSAIFTPHH